MSRCITNIIAFSCFVIFFACDRKAKNNREESPGDGGKTCLVEACDAQGVQKGPIVFGESDDLGAGSIGSEKYTEPLNFTEESLQTDSRACQFVILQSPTNIDLFESLKATAQASFTAKPGSLWKAEEFAQNGKPVSAPDGSKETSQTWFRVSNEDASQQGWVNALFARCR